MHYANKITIIEWWLQKTWLVANFKKERRILFYFFTARREFYYSILNLCSFSSSGSKLFDRKLRLHPNTSSYFRVNLPSFKAKGLRIGSDSPPGPAEIIKLVILASSLVMFSNFGGIPLTVAGLSSLKHKWTGHPVPNLTNLLGCTLKDKHWIFPLSFFLKLSMLILA